MTVLSIPDQILSVYQASAWAQIDAAQLVESEAAKLKSIIKNVSTVCNEYEAARMAATVDSDLSFAGQKAAIKRAAEKGATTIRNQTDAFIADVEARAGKLASALANSVEVGKPDALEMMQLIERRALLAAMDRLDVGVIYSACCQTGEDELTARAIETGPPFLKLVKPAQVELGKAQRAARMNPDMASELDKLRRQREICAMSRNAGLRELAQSDDPIAEQAKGQKKVDYIDGDSDGSEA
jgi:hypothetical protein